MERLIAADFNFIQQPGAEKGSTIPELGDLVSRIVNILLFVAGVAAIIVLAFFIARAVAGYVFTTATGTPGTSGGSLYDPSGGLPPS